MCDFLSTLIGIPIGVVCSLVAWWIVFHGIVPKLDFSEHISKTLDERSDGLPTYRIKIRNCGYRDIVDVQLFARVYVTGLNPRSPSTRRIVLIPLGIAQWPTLEVKGGAKLTALLSEKAVALTESWYPESVRTMAASGTMKLEDILSMGESAQLQMAAFAYDAFSGTRKVFVSKYYSKDDVRVGRFEPDSLQVTVSAP
ncbi:hypothetical protein [Nevskia sp.]|uniref:hypothetical protein n=1 Tax=Nevskia sp. TaxID=1929292 RepID=UPI0025D84015|nr:hypothetical protein [Nevskia sp.]